MKTLNLIAWISGAIGIVFVLLGFLQFITGRLIETAEIINCFHAANSFFLITIALFVYLIKNQNKKD